MRLTLVLDVPGQWLDSRPEESIVSGILSPSAEALFSDHVVGGGILLPGVGYLEMMFAATRRTVLKAVAFIRPCILPVPRPDAPEKCILRCTRRGRDAFEIASWTGVKTSGDLKFSTHFSASFEDMESGSIATTHTLGRRDFVLTKCSQSVPRKHPAVTSAGDLSFAAKTLLCVRGFVARGARWAHQLARSTGARMVLWNSLSCALRLENDMALVNATRNSVDEKRVALRLAKILCAPAKRHRACSAVAWQARHCHSFRYECTKFASTRDAKVIRIRLINERFRELRMTTSGKLPKRKAYSPMHTRTKDRSKMAKRSPPAASVSAGSRTRSRDDLIQELTAITATIIGSAVSADAPLMSAGLDSIATTELSALMSERFNTELPQTLLFDHPSLQSVADFLLLER